jgi:DNA-binding transcriptional ArsR family regulator
MLTSRKGKAVERRRIAERRTSQRRDNVFYAVADPTRRALLDLLAQGEEPVNSLAERFSMSRPAISQHLAILLKARLVRARRVGRERRYRLEPRPLEAIRDWVGLYERFWNTRLTALGRHLKGRS